MNVALETSDHTWASSHKKSEELVSSGDEKRRLQRPPHLSHLAENTLFTYAHICTQFVKICV